MEMLERAHAHRKILRTIQGLPFRCPKEGIGTLLGCPTIADLISWNKLLSIVALPNAALPKQVLQCRLQKPNATAWISLLEAHMDVLNPPSAATLLQNTPSKSCWKRCITKILGTRAYLHLLDQAEVKSDLEQLSMCEPNFLVHSPIWGTTYCAEHVHLHLTTRSNFSVRLLLGCQGLGSDASRFNSRSNGRSGGDPSCKLCYAQLEDAIDFGSTEIFASDKKTDANRSEEATVRVY